MATINGIDFVAVLVGPARPEGFLEKFYASRDEGRGPIGTGI
ncbi:hypothetical protein [Sporisorium scitamineum]|uniref:Uncharacterized protein n=1 Tax=Sporisorium scitamineum TaxID=49012 RepID=A0A0F7SCX9_9BASI|nr:hypothetical protein [Sporisorium scitamineum]